MLFLWFLTESDACDMGLPDLIIVAPTIDRMWDVAFYHHPNTDMTCWDFHHDSIAVADGVIIDIDVVE